MCLIRKFVIVYEGNKSREKMYCGEFFFVHHVLDYKKIKIKYHGREKV